MTQFTVDRLHESLDRLDTGDPLLIGDGPVCFSTSLEIMPEFRVIWDANGYYRELGVEPGATRREIREAYQEKRGWRSTRLTYIVRQLLDPRVRAKYDRVPWGSYFFDDYIEDLFRKARVREAVALRLAGWIDEAIELEASEPEWERNLSQQPSRVESSGYSEEGWPWAFYLWGSQCEDKARLRQWQELLISVLGERKEHHQLAVGFSGNKGPWGVREVGYRVVVFLDEDEQPTEALAQRVASRVIEHTTIKEKLQWQETSERVLRQQPRLPRVDDSPVPSISV